AGELAVHAHRGLTVGEQPPGDGHHPVAGGQLAEARLVRDHRTAGHGRPPWAAGPASPGTGGVGPDPGEAATGSGRWKQVRSPVWQATPICSTDSSTASPSQSSAAD